MPNVLDVAPVRMFAARAAALIPNPSVAERYEKLTFARMLADERNFRAATLWDMKRAPSWAQDAHARGELLSVFRLHPGAAGRVRTIARRIARACSLAALDPVQFETHLAAIAAAGVFLDKFARADFDTASRKALILSRLYAIVEDDLVCETPAVEVPGTDGRLWRRVRSVSELRQTGREFHNCLARTPRHASYGAMITRNTAQFWVLRDAAGLGLVIALARLSDPARFTEVRGPRNAPVAHDNQDLALLASALGIAPPSPPSPRLDAELETMLEWLRGAGARAAPLRPLARAH
ncbi:MAG: hypothetical protein ABL883_08045 [Terricaulis sp.]